MTRRVLLLSMATTTLVVIAFLVPLLVLVRYVQISNSESAGRIEAQGIAVQVGIVDDNALAAALGALNGMNERKTTVFMLDRGQPARLLGAPAAAGDPVVDQAAAGSEPFVSPQPGGEAWYVPVTTGKGKAVIRTFIPAGALTRGVGSAWTALVILGLVLLGLAGLVAALLGRSLVRPLLAVARTADTLRAGDLDARATEAGPPEVRRIAGALNRLADRIADLLQAERESMADVSHRLRTPLTALRLDAEALPKSEDADRLLADVDEVERMVTHVITRTRRPTKVGSCDLAAVVRTRVAFWSVLAEEQGRAVASDIPDEVVTVALPDETVGAAVDALLGNVFAHTEVGVGFAVAVVAEPVPTLVVEDAGPGIDDPRLLARGESDGASTGLGIDIVRRTALEAGGSFELSSADPHGLCAVVTFAPPPNGAVTQKTRPGRGARPGPSY
jgi:signal transduction histidine kinase